MRGFGVVVASRLKKSINFGRVVIRFQIVLLILLLIIMTIMKLIKMVAYNHIEFSGDVGVKYFLYLISWLVIIVCADKILFLWARVESNDSCVDKVNN